MKTKQTCRIYHPLLGDNNILWPMCCALCPGVLIIHEGEDIMEVACISETRVSIIGIPASVKHLKHTEMISANNHAKPILISLQNSGI